MSEVPSHQEMFDRAVRGLASQDWEPAMMSGADIPYKRCLYLTEDGRRCAWGWVDTSLTADDQPLCAGLSAGIAGNLDDEQRDFAIKLQAAHDDPALRDTLSGCVPVAQRVKASLIRFGIEHDLVWPAEVPQ